eukprot:scaffold55923_cov25-Tisochrysis_lutea.AAC.1
MGEDLEFVPQVLVVGATGRTGLIIVRKLLLRGFRVAVLVRSLSTDTLNRLGQSPARPSSVPASFAHIAVLFRPAVGARATHMPVDLSASGRLF